MKKLIFLVLFVTAYVASFAQFPPQGKVEFKTMPSKILNEDREYSVYLPKSYATNTEKTYPVLYLLHGGGGSHKDWPGRGHVGDVANQLMDSNEACEMIIVCPEAGKTFMNYFNHPEWRFQDYFFEEMIPFIESNYRIIGDKQHRAIAGLSMGGGGTVVYATSHPELFCAAYEMSGYLYRQDLPFLDKNDPVQERMQTLVEDHNCVKIIQNADAKAVEALKTVNWFIDCGDDDFTFDPNMEFISALRQKQIPYQLRVRDGGHTWEYWHSALYIALPFVSNCFRGN
ncbi:alpha/beta hydrolase-fold protein [uncultured Draconibacterium sp.]|uniref:alpha/beta hydrolase n=1 Tax=uncultured Draconibacterium sp. TaxID=1573823 RepID=UPI0032162BB6